MRNIFRPIKDGEDVTDIVGKCLVGLIVLAAVIILLIAGWSMYRSVPKDGAVKAYRQELIQREADPAWQKEQRRLKKKHGVDRVPIYEPGQTPYYHCGENRKKKCWFM